MPVQGSISIDIDEGFTTRLKDRIIAKVTFSAWSITLHRPRNLHDSIAAFVTDFYFVNHV